MLRIHRRAHARFWPVAAIALPVILIAAMVWKHTRPPLAPHVQLVPPAASDTVKAKP
jgi:hypothetical protein